MKRSRVRKKPKFLVCLLFLQLPFTPLLFLTILLISSSILQGTEVILKELSVMVLLTSLKNLAQYCLHVVVPLETKTRKNLHMMIWLYLENIINILLDVLFLLVLICFSGVTVQRTLLCQQIRIYNEYKSNNPKGLARATSTSATAGAVTLPLIKPNQRSHLFSNQHVLLMIVFIIEYCKLSLLRQLHSIPQLLSNTLHSPKKEPIFVTYLNSKY